MVVRDLILTNARRRDIYNHPTAMLKFNTTLKQLGFKKAEHGIVIDSMIKGRRELTMSISPNLGNINHSDRITQHFSEETQTILKEFKGYNEREFRHGITIIRHNELKPILLKIDGDTFGEYHRNKNLFILYMNILDGRFSDGYDDIFLFFLDNIIEFCRNNQVKEEDNSEEIKKELLNDFKKTILEQKQKHYRTMREKQSYIKEHEEKLVEYWRDIGIAKRQIEDINNMGERLDEEVFDRMEEVRQLPFITAVRLSSRGIRIDFKEIKIPINTRVGEKIIDIGEIYTYIKPNTIEIINKNPITAGGGQYHTNHISGSSICFGRQNTKAYELLGKILEKDGLKKLAYFLWLYLKTYNANDTYCSAHDWILARENNDKFEGIHNKDYEDIDREGYRNDEDEDEED